ncbi:caspase-3 isoform X1 [Nothobranchius furzeri]|uniref:Transcript variant X1 n=3 Tax=Nothobranchius TaxID=28779 RepID=A0A1A8B3M2_NOTFU|nr:transcript variant X1 [Nothobranchius furzeri]
MSTGQQRQPSRFRMSKDTLRSNKTDIVMGLCGDYRLVLNKVLEKKLITQREYNNLKSIPNENIEGHVVELVDKIMNKGEDTCKAFLDLLQTDDEIKTTLPELANIQDNCLLPTPAQESSLYGDAPEAKRLKQEELYELRSQPVGLCMIINNEKFSDGTSRGGTNTDAQSLAEVFHWLGFRVLMCKDQTREQMSHTVAGLASLSDGNQLQGLSVQEWNGSRFTAPQQALQHGDAFFCCILSHGEKGAVWGTDLNPLAIKEITRSFKATEQSALTGKPKVFLIQACQGRQKQRGVMLKDVETDGGSPSIPEEADVLVAVATVEDHQAFRHPVNGSWFVQSVCQQLKERCPSGEDFTSILHYVNGDVGQKEAFSQPVTAKQMPEVRFTLTKRLVLSPQRM